MTSDALEKYEIFHQESKFSTKQKVLVILVIAVIAAAIVTMLMLVNSEEKVSENADQNMDTEEKHTVAEEGEELQLDDDYYDLDDDEDFDLDDDNYDY